MCSWVAIEEIESPRCNNILKLLQTLQIACISQILFTAETSAEVCARKGSPVLQLGTLFAFLFRVHEVPGDVHVMI